MSEALSGIQTKWRGHIRRNAGSSISGEIKARPLTTLAANWHTLVRKMLVILTGPAAFVLHHARFAIAKWIPRKTKPLSIASHYGSHVSLPWCGIFVLMIMKTYTSHCCYCGDAGKFNGRI